MEPIERNQEDIILPEGVEMDINQDLVQETQPNFAEINTEPTEAQQEETPEEPAAETEADLQVEDTATTEGVAPEPVPEEEQTPESSLPSEQPAEAVEEVETPQPEAQLSEESVLQYLSEALGKPVESLDQLLPEPVDPLEGDEDLRALVEWRERTGRPLSDYVNYQKDYKSMSDQEVAREYLRHEFPDFSEEDIQLELQQYIPDEDDLDREAALKKLNLKKLVMKGRRELDSLRLELGKPAPTKLTPEQEQAISFYQQSQEQQAKAQKIQEANSKNIQEGLKKVETLSLNLGDGKSIEFKPKPEARQKLQEFMQMPNWYNQDGTINGAEIVKDSFYLQNREAIHQEIYQQGVARGLEELESKVNNETISKPATQQGPTDQNQIIIEGLDSMTKKSLQWGR
jgi:hypothetical protein